MRSPWRIATAVREPSGSIRVKSYPFVSLTRRSRLWGAPVFRGAVGLFEAMRIGMDSLNWAAEIAGEEESEPTLWDRFLGVVFTIFALAAGIGLFMAVPYLVAGLIPSAENQVHFHLVAGTLRVALLIGYMWGISLIPDITRVFRYHGAEHKSIFAWEKGLELNNGNACDQSRFHPRCGTSFLLLAAVLTMLGFMLFDSAWVALLGPIPNVLVRIAVHLPMIPVVAGLSYEVLRLIEKHSDNPAWRPLILPGFWLQKITTREPDADQVDVALAALTESLREDKEDYEGEPRPVEFKDPAAPAEALTG